MKKQGLLILGVLIILIFVGCNNPKIEVLPNTENEEAVELPKDDSKEEAALEFKKIENVFGFADESGKRLITIPNQNGDKLPTPEAFNVALGNNGEILEIGFVKRQEANSMDTYRQSMYNFNNMAGYIYEIKAGELIPNKTYLLSTVEIINKPSLIKLNSTRASESSMDYYQKVDAEIISKIEAVKSRKVVKSSLISETLDHAQIGLFVFERQGEDMLASIAYVAEDKVVFKDYPAKYNEMSTWRVDAGDEPGLFEVLFLAHSDEGMLLGLTWAAPEGENAFVLKEVNGVFEETELAAGRYWSP